MLPCARHPVAVAPADAEPRWRSSDPLRFACDLATLGPVFCVWTEPYAHPVVRTSAVVPDSPDGLLLARPGLLAHACAVTPDGPREWITVHDRSGLPRCRLYLLPDTDYLAWDGLLAHTGPAAAPEVRPRWRARRGRRLRFEVEPIGPCSLVCVRTAAPGCALSRRTARELARAEGVSLVA